MAVVREMIEQYFETLARLICCRPWFTLATMVAVAGIAASQLPKLTMDTSTEGFLVSEDPILKAYDDFRDQFGRNEIIVIAIEPPEVFGASFLKRLKAFHEELEQNVPHLQEVTSLINARNTRGEEDSLIVEELARDIPTDAAGIALLKARVMGNPQYENAVISEDGKITTVIVKASAFASQHLTQEDALSGFDDEGPATTPTNDKPAYLTNQQVAETLRAVQATITKYRADDFDISVAGSPVIMAALKKTMTRDMGQFMRLALLVIALCLFLLFRRLSGVLLPLVIVALAVATTMGLMAAAGIPLKMSSMILPSFLLAVGVGDSMHLLVIFYQQLEATGQKQTAIVRAMGHSGLAVVMTSLTTAAGLGSFATAEVAPVADLGIFAAIGVLLAMLYSIILLPALLAIAPFRIRPVKTDQPSALSKLLDRLTDLTVGSPRGVIAVSALLLAISIFGIARLDFSHNLLTWLPEDLPERRHTEKIDRELRGSIVVEAIIDTGEPNGLYDPVILKALDTVARELKQSELAGIPIGRTSSLADVLKEIHQALNANDPKYHAIADDPALIPQEILLFENAGSDDLQDLVDSRFSRARLSVVVPWMDAMRYLPFLEQLEERLRASFGPEVGITVTGLMTLFARTISASIFSAAKSYMIAFVVITLMMVFLVGKIRDGLVSVIPNLAPIVVVLGIMGWLDLPLDMFTMLIGSIAIGLAVDDTIHFMHNFRRCQLEGEDVHTSVRVTLHTSGRAMLATTAALSVGFFVFAFGSMNNVALFGLLTGTTIILALLADFLLAPALMAWIHRSH